MNKGVKDIIHIPTNMLVSEGEDSIKAIMEIINPNFISIMILLFSRKR